MKNQDSIIWTIVHFCTHQHAGFCDPRGSAEAAAETTKETAKEDSPKDDDEGDKNDTNANRKDLLSMPTLRLSVPSHSGAGSLGLKGWQILRLCRYFSWAPHSLQSFALRRCLVFKKSSEPLCFGPNLSVPPTSSSVCSNAPPGQWK